MAENQFTLNNNSGCTQSLWMETKIPSFPSLKSNMSADVCIIGSGIVGLTCAYNLLKKGKSVIILESGAIAGGQTARTTGHLTWVLDDRFVELEKLFGIEQTQLAAESHLAAIDWIEKIIAEEKIECDFERVDGYLFPSNKKTGKDPKKIIDEEWVTLQKMGMEVEKVTRAPFSSSFDTGTSILIPHQAQFHILKYMRGLIDAIVKEGGRIFCNSHVTNFKEGAPCITKTVCGAEITSQSVIVATCTPINNRFIIHTKQSAYRTYVIAATVAKDSIPKGLYWDTEDPYHYLRIQKHSTDPNLDWVIVGGEDHKTGQDNEIESKYCNLEKWARERLPTMGRVEYRWSGQIFEPVDSLAFIGRNPGDANTYIATGDSGNGLTHGTVAGILISDLILEKKNSWERIYEPSRKTLSAALEFISENANTAKQYVDWFTPGEREQIDKLPNNEGIIVRKGLEKIAIYKDNESKIHINSALCPHLGGCVRWNHSEKSWDCPCHGSRFNGCGEVMDGPAIGNLSPISKT